MSGDATPVEISAVLTGLACSELTDEEIAGAADAMRAASTKVDVGIEHVVDTCGTGGSGKNKLFNISSAAAIVAAAGGAFIAKHGNRGISSKSGSADVLETAGVNIHATPEQVARCIREVGVGFLFAQSMHPAMRFAGPVRKELGIRTIFNLLGPLTNPANAKRQVIGVFSPDIQSLMARAAQRLGCEHVLVVHADGLDEMSTASDTRVCEIKAHELSEYVISPSRFGFADQDLSTLKAQDAIDSLRLIKQSVTEPESAAANIVALNAGAALYVGGICHSIETGVSLAQDLISTGQANEKLQELIAFSKALDVA